MLAHGGVPRSSPPGSFFTPFSGGAQRLPNGNTLVTESAFGRLFEVDQTGQVRWEYVGRYCPRDTTMPTEACRASSPSQTNAIFRAYRYAPDEVPGLNDRGAAR